MLVNIGKRTQPGDLVDLLLECHGRIRAFVGMAAALGSGDVPGPEAQELALRVHRYFAEALPLHVRDEEDSLVPRLRGIDPQVDAALSRMQAEHVEHVPALGGLLSLTQRIASDPHAIAALAPHLATVAAELGASFEVHLTSEEHYIFPVVRRLLSTREQVATVRELRARRALPAPVAVL